MLRRGRAVALIATLAVVTAITVSLAALDDGGDTEEGTTVRVLDSDERVFDTSDPVERACALKPEHLVRLWRGYYPHRGADLMMVPQTPNFVGSFDLNSHAGPWDYLQKVPLVFYGSRIEKLGSLPEIVNVTSVYPTAGRLLGVALRERDGPVLTDILGDGPLPKLVLTVVWDGVGRNVLERWPNAWPNLARIERQGASFVNAIVGSTPSVTPTIHATLGTGVFPRKHGITTIDQRNDEGEIEEVFTARDMSDLELATYGDEIDAAFGNVPKVGLLGWVSWHLAMMSHGAEIPGGDADEVVMVGKSGADLSQESGGFSTPSYAAGFPTVDGRVEELDREDGRVDGKWLSHEILERPDNPAWMRFQGDLLLEMLEEGGYGRDDVPDLLFTNFKSTDLAGHHYTMDSREMAETLQAQDTQLGRVLDYLDSEVRDYVVIVTADHGHTPSHERTGAWPISNAELKLDLAREFEVPQEVELVQSSPSGLHFYRPEFRKYGINEADVATFLNGYTIADNWPDEDLPAGYEARSGENVFSAAFLSGQLNEIMTCAFGSKTPPSDL